MSIHNDPDWAEDHGYYHWKCRDCGMSGWTDTTPDCACESEPVKREPNIKTEYVYPPIPNRNFDWSAIDDDTYDGPGSPIGTGPTEQAAIDDLLEQLEEQ